MKRQIAILVIITSVPGCIHKVKLHPFRGDAPVERDEAAIDPRYPHEYRVLPTKPTQYAAHLLEIAKNYESYGRYDSRMRWAPETCAQFEFPDPPSLDYSSNGDSEGHGKKLYSLFALPIASFAKDDTESPQQIEPGRIVVKEAWFSKEVPDPGGSLPSLTRQVKTWYGEPLRDSYVPYGRKKGHLYTATAKAGLFVMFKLHATAPGTDEGWVYGTLTADGKKVTSVGRVQRCMRCHDNAPGDHLFGPAKE